MSVIERWSTDCRQRERMSEANPFPLMALDSHRRTVCNFEFQPSQPELLVISKKL